jgi:LysM repeat protein
MTVFYLPDSAPFSTTKRRCKMPTNYTIRSGDTLSKIALSHGFNDYRDIYNHPSNAAFRAKRPNPNLIYPGDVIVIPDKAGMPIKPLTTPPNSEPIVDDFEPPVSSFPEDLKATLRTSNGLRTPQNHYLAPIIPWGEDRKTLRELSRLIAVSPDFPIVREIYDRMSRYGIWQQIRAIRNVYRGIGSHGFQCDPVNHEAFLRTMTLLTRPRGAIEGLAFAARFCRDIKNVHGPRDSFRENVAWGPGLHICITQPAQRASEACDIHIDQYQQGSDCVAGYCIPRVLDPRTIAHIISVGPWLTSEAKQTIRDYLHSKGIQIPW